MSGTGEGGRPLIQVGTMKQIIRLLLIPAILAALSACNDDALQSVAAKANQPLPQEVVAKMKSEGMSRTSPIMMRIFKQEGVLEIWKRKDTGRYGMIAQYKICAWSGDLGPKKKEGDRQSPEGFYLIKPSQMNPDSHYYLAFNIGYPNAFDRAHGRTGSNIMIHGVCSSAGCYSMTDKNVAQIYAFARDAFEGGQRAFQVEAFPFRMTPENMAKHRDDPNMDFWKMLKVGYDYFEITKEPPEVNVCDRKYVFNQQVMDGSPFVATAACPSMKTPEPLQTAYSSYEKRFDKAYEVAVAQQAEAAAQKAEVAQRTQEMIAQRAEAKADAERRKEAARAATGRFFSSLTSFLPGSSDASDGSAGAAVASLSPAQGGGSEDAGRTAPSSGQSAASDAPVPQSAPRGTPDYETASAGSGQHKPFWKFW